MSAVDWLAAPVVPLAWCWRMDRADGISIGLTTHDRPLTIAGLVYSPEPGLRPSAIRQRRGLMADSLDIDGALTSDMIRADDLEQGRWDGARVTVLVADWQNADARHLCVASGQLGGISSDGAAFTAELSDRRAALDGAIVPLTSAGCRAELGDAQCGVALAACTRTANVAAVNGRHVVLAGTWPADQLRYGRLRWLDGAARGLHSVIAAQNGSEITLVQPPRGATPAPGDRVEVVQGCDKQAATCAARFANIANFRGEPHLPGMDLLTRFPGA